MLLSTLEKRPDIAETLHGSFERMLARYREAQHVLPGNLATETEAEAGLPPAVKRG